MKQFLLTQFDFNHHLFNNALDSFTDEETNQRLYGDTRINHVKYIAGHLVNTQNAFGLLANVPVNQKWNDLFAGRKQTKARDDIPYPPIEEITNEWNRIYKPVRDGLAKLSDAELNSTAPDPMNKIFENSEFFSNSIAGVWTFFNYHQTYHIGQIGILRRGFGKDPIFG